MLLDLNHTHTNIDSLIPFISRGIIIDTSVLDVFINGFINTRFCKKLDKDFNDLTGLFDLLKINNDWKKFYITPHILSEACNHLKNRYRKRGNYCSIVKEIIPIFNDVNERQIMKDEILNKIDFKNPIVEIADISIFLATKEFLDTDGKVAILVMDRRFNEEYENNPNVLIIDFHRIKMNCL